MKTPKTIHYAINGNRLNCGEIGMKTIIRNGKPAIVVYWPAGIQSFPDVLTGDNYLQRWEKIKKYYGLVEEKKEGTK